MRTNKFKQIIIIFISWFYGFGIDLRVFLVAVNNFPSVLMDYIKIKSQNEKNDRKWKIYFTLPNFIDKKNDGGTANGHYFHQDLLVARKIFQRNPIKHLDVGSRIDGFAAHVAVFRPIEVLDIRPIPGSIPNMTFRQCNILELSTDLYDCCDSLSCLHALEHFGLGRYCDPVKVDGYQIGFNNLVRMLKINGVLYLSVPIGSERIEFNGHRVFNIKTILDLAKTQMVLTDFEFVDDIGNLHADININNIDLENNYFLNYGCGIFEFMKIRNLPDL
jgi:hypothetical protein